VITVHFLVDWALRSTILIAGGTLLLWALRAKDPAVRLAAWTALLFGSLAIPLLSVTLPRVAVPAVQRKAAPAVSITMVFAQPSPAPAAIAAHRDAAAPFDWAGFAVTLYGMGTGLLLLRLLVGLAVCRHLLARSRATDQIDVVESDGVSSPVTLGVVRPVIVLPVDWRDWEQAKLEAVLAHERSHIRRRDPPVQVLSAIHRALLWHSPLSWYLHVRLVREAEQVSDDAAVAAIRDRAWYAEMLLEFMQRGVRRAGWQGVPMARYSRPEARIDRILDATALSRGITRWSVAAIVALATPLAYVVAAASPQHGDDAGLKFEAASVKVSAPMAGLAGVQRRAAGERPVRDEVSGGPGTGDPTRIHYPRVAMDFVLLKAYDIDNFQLVGPDWIGAGFDRFDIDATIPANSTPEQFRSMLRNLLAERFKLTAHRETRELAGYALVVAKNGPRFKEAAPVAAKPHDGAPDTSRPGPDGYFPAPDRPGIFFQLAGMRAARSTFREVTMQTLVDTLQNQLKRPVNDATGLTAKYDFVLDYSIEGLNLGSGRMLVGPGDSEPQPDLAGALQSQLGLRLEAKKVSVSMVVIDHIEKSPTEN
jgi:uncharacterized protein (TIGR03435 family)